MGSVVQFPYVPLGNNVSNEPHEFDIREEIERDKIFCCDVIQSCSSFCMLFKKIFVYFVALLCF